MAASGLPPLARPTCNAVAVPTTWALVTMSPLASYTTPDPDPSLVEICTTDGSTRPTTCSYCCSREEAAPDEGSGADDAEEEAAAEEGLADAPGPLPPALVQATALKTTRVIPAAPSRLPTAGRHGPASAAGPLPLLPGTRLLLRSMPIPALLSAQHAIVTRPIASSGFLLGPLGPDFRHRNSPNTAAHDQQFRARAGDGAGPEFSSPVLQSTADRVGASLQAGEEDGYGSDSAVTWHG